MDEYELLKGNAKEAAANCQVNNLNLLGTLKVS